MKRILWVMLILIMATMACSLPLSQESVVTSAAEIPALNEGVYTETIMNQGMRVEITVPESYEIGANGNGLSSIIQDIQGQNVPNLESTEGLFESLDEAIVLWGYDRDTPGGLPSGFVLVKNEEFAFMPLGMLSMVAGTLLGDDVTIVSQERVTLGERDILRFTTRTDQAGLPATQLVYVFKELGQLWIAGFLTEPGRIHTDQVIFDAIVASLDLTN